MAELDILIEDPRWTQSGLDATMRRACDGVFAALALDPDFEVSLLACDDARIAVLNAAFRDKATPTNVLSWPGTDLAPEKDGDTPPAPDITQPELGDIAIAFDTCTREAAAQNKPFQHHVTHLLVHGLLHLLGYDHDRGQDAALMEGLETQILANLGIPDPY